MLARIRDKYSVWVLYCLSQKRRLRFSELQRCIEGISQRMLTVTLRALEHDGLVRRTVHPEIPPRVEYSLTPLGATLRATVRQFIDWSSAHLEEVDAARAAYGRRNDQAQHAVK